MSLAFAGMLLACAVPLAARAVPPPTGGSEDNEFFELSIEDLVQVQVTSVAGTERDWFTTPAAITVITGKQLLDSGLTTLAEALRLVPGMQVGRIDSRQWSVTARGFSNLFSNKLQVVIDGRVVYNELFGGVFWDVQDPLLEDIDRIEVIRGPGATLWGANAVNGVVNVITKSTRETVGNFVGGGGGNEERGFVGARHGGALGEDGAYRIWGRYVDRDSTRRESNGTRRADKWSLPTGGVQLEYGFDHGIEVYVQGQGHSTKHLGQSLPGPANTVINGDGSSDGGHALARISQSFDSGQHWTLQSYYDIESRTSVDGFDERRDTWDVDFRHRFSFLNTHDVIWGVGYRHRRQRSEPSPALALVPPDRSSNLVTGFLQDSITLIDDELFLMLGSKFEYNSFTHFEIQPSGRLWWEPNDDSLLWLAISRPVRTPTLIEEDLFFDIPSIGVLRGNRALDAETTIAYELGGRVSPTKGLMIDVAAFFNDHDDLIVRTPTGPGAETFTNLGRAYGYGVEASAIWQALPRLRLEGSYTFYQLDARNLTTLPLERISPMHQFQIHSQLELIEGLGVNAAVYYVSSTRPRDSPVIDDWFRVDVGLIWEPRDGVEIAVFGQNLAGDHPEYFSAVRVDSQPEIERGGYVRVRLNF